MEKNTDKSRTKRRRRQRWIGYIAFLTAVLSAAAVLCLAMFFKTQTIVVEGAKRYTDEELISASGIRLEENVFTIDLEKTAKQIKDAFFYLEEVKVTPVLPTTMKITVVESVPGLAVVNSADSYTLLSTGGRIIEQCQGLSDQGLPLVVGTDFSVFPQGSYPGVLPREVTSTGKGHRDATPQEQEGYRVMQTLGYVMAAVEEVELEEVDYVDVSDDLSTSILWNHRILLKLGTELELPHKLKLARAVAEGELKEDFTGSIDLSVLPKIPKAYSKEESIEKLLNPLYLENYLKYE